jgi:hypothetical protein
LGTGPKTRENKQALTKAPRENIQASFWPSGQTGAFSFLVPAVSLPLIHRRHLHAAGGFSFSWGAA